MYFFQFSAFEFQRAVYIAIKSDLDTGMTENLTETLYLYALFYAPGSKRMPESVKRIILDPASFENVFKIILHIPRLGKLILSSCQHILLAVLTQRKKQSEKLQRNRYCL